MKKKLAVLFSLVLLALVGLVARITYINATSGSKYRKQVLSQAQQKYENQTLPAKRGDIYDRNGNILATSNKVYNVVLDCLEVNKDQDSVEPTIKALVEVLGLDEDEMRKLLTDSSTKKSQYQIVKKQISMDDKKAFEKYEDPGDDSELTATQLKERSRITGVWFEEDISDLIRLMRLPVIPLDLHFPEMWRMPDWKDITMRHLPAWMEDSTDTSTTIPT